MLGAWEPGLRLALFAIVLVVMAVWEVARPRRPQQLGRVSRWPSNLGVVALDTIVVRLVLPMSAVGLAILWEERGWGLLQALGSPHWISMIVSLLVLDLAIFGQHVMFHFVPVLWRLHRMHHADQEFDATTGIRFHPIEILLSMGVKFAVIAAFGTPAAAVFVFEVVLNATSMFNHGNVTIPKGWDRALRWVLVTPDMHRVHHSIVTRETNSNFGFNLPWWDYIFGTYVDQPAAGHDGMILGIDQFRTPEEQRLDRMLTQPFRNDTTGQV